VGVSRPVGGPVAVVALGGTAPSDFGGVCVSGQSGGQPVMPATPSGTGAVFGVGPNELPSVDGIPCTLQKIGTCIGLAESQG